LVHVLVPWGLLALNDLTDRCVLQPQVMSNRRHTVSVLHMRLPDSPSRGGRGSGLEISVGRSGRAPDAAARNPGSTAGERVRSLLWHCRASGRTRAGGKLP